MWLNLFYSVPVLTASQSQCVSTIKGTQYSFTCLHMGYHKALSLCTIFAGKVIISCVIEHARKLLVSIPNQDIPEKGWDPRVSTTGWTSALEAPSAHFYRLVDHCQWSGHLVLPMAETMIPYPYLPPLGWKNSMNLLPHRSPKYKSHMSVYLLKPEYKASSRNLFPSEFDQNSHFTSQHTQCWAL